MVSDTFARRAFPGRDAVGQVIRLGLPTGERLTIVGVVADSRRVSLETAPFGQVYEPAAQSAYFVPTRVLVRSTAPLDDVVATLTRAVRAIDPAQPVANVRTLDAVVSRSVASRRFTVTLIGGFAVTALLLAGVGLYGLLAQVVAQRQSEIGLRMALGASPGSVVWLVTRDALRAVLIGVPCGLAGSWAASRLLSRFVYGVSLGDPRIALGVVLTIALITAAAAFVPTRRATRLDPLTTLRSE
jgi:ABC-type antimicrobial peptide transport system permease subunit